MDDSKPKVRKPRIRKAPVTVREKAEQERIKTEKVSSKQKVATGAKHKAKKAGAFLGKEYYMPMPDNRVGRFMNKRRSFIPKYFRDSWAELKLVTWPGRLETWRLTFAVFIFAILFGIFIGVIDKGLDTLFKDIILE